MQYPSGAGLLAGTAGAEGGRCAGAGGELASGHVEMWSWESGFASGAVCAGEEERLLF